MRELTNEPNKLLIYVSFPDICELPTNRALLRGLVLLLQDIEPDFFTENDESYGPDEEPAALLVRMLRQLYAEHALYADNHPNFLGLLDHYGIPDFPEDKERGDTIITVLLALAGSVRTEAAVLPIAEEDRIDCSELISHGQSRLREHLEEIYALTSRDEALRAVSASAKKTAKPKSPKKPKTKSPRTPRGEIKTYPDPDAAAQPAGPAGPTDGRAGADVH